MKYVKSILFVVLGLVNLNAYSQCTILSDSTVCLDEPIGFSVQSSTTVSSISWDFGDGNNSSQITPFHRYTSIGSKTVKASVSLVGGGSCTVIKKVFVHDPPKVDIRISPNSKYCLTDNLICLIDSTKKGQTGLAIAKRIILWGDGNKTETVNPSPGSICFKYKVSGKFTITVEEINTRGCSEYKEIDVEVFPKYEPSFYLDSTARACDGVTLCLKSDSTSVNPIVDYFRWDFGDGSFDTTNLLGTCHKFTSDGLKTIRMIVRTKDGCLGTTENSYFVSLPKVNFDLTKDSQNVKCFPNAFSYSQKEDSRYEYAWWYTDSNGVVIDGLGENHSTFMAPMDVGKYIIFMSINDGFCKKTTVVDTVQSIGVNAEMSVFNNLQCDPLDTVYVCQKSTFYLTDTAVYFWNFKDSAAPQCTTDMYQDTGKGNNCNFWWGPKAQHFYGVDSCTEARLIARDLKFGCIDSTSEGVVIGRSGRKDFSFYANKFCVGLDDANLINFRRPPCGSSEVKINLDSACGKDDFRFWRSGNIYTSTCDTSRWITVGIAVQNGSVKIYRSCDSNDYYIDSSKMCRDTFWYHNWFQLQPTPVPSFKYNVETCVPALSSVELDFPTQPLVRNIFYDWGDGVIDTITMPDVYDSMPKRYHTYQDAAEFEVRVTMRTDSNCIADRFIPEFTGYRNGFNFDSSVCIGYEQTMFDSLWYWPDPETFPWRDTSKGKPEQLSWDFGDGRGFVTSGPKPKISYGDRGVYTIKMASVDRHGCHDTAEQRIYVGGSKAGIKAINKQIVCDDDIQFFDSSISTNVEDSITEHKWLFGDGRTPSYEKDPFHFYSIFGKYEITHIVTSANGCKDTATESLIVDGPVPSFDIITDTVGCAPHTVTFSNNSRNVSNYIWYFGDNANTTLSTSMDTNVSFTYTQPGTYYIYLYGSDSVLDLENSDIRFCQGIFPDTTQDVYPVRRVVVLPIPPADFDLQESACVGEEITLVDRSDAIYEDLYWYISNGDTVMTTRQNGTYTFDTSGVYTVFFAPRYVPVGTYSGPCFDTLSKSITIHPRPVAAFELARLDCDGNATFNNTSEGAQTYAWNFGDPDIPDSDVDNPTVKYDSGTYTVTLEATNAFGCKDTTDRVVDYDPNNKVVADLKVDPIEGCAPLRIRISNIPSISDNYWDMGDGNIYNDTVITTHLYDTAGSYPIVFTATDSTSCNISDTFEVTVNAIQRPLAGFFAKTNFCTGEVSFKNLSVDAQTYLWDFGDGRTSKEKSPVIHYKNDGNYTVTLTVNDTLICRSQFINDINVETTKDTGLLIPNVFTPDYDDYNKCYSIEGASPACYDFKIKIYNRWGDIVFESDDVRECWDGRDVKTNVEYPSGTYYSIINVTNKFSGEEEEITGTITLIR